MQWDRLVQSGFAPTGPFRDLQKLDLINSLLRFCFDFHIRSKNTTRFVDLALDTTGEDDIQDTTKSQAIFNMRCMFQKILHCRSI